VEAIGQTAGASGPLLSAAERTTLCHDLKHTGPTSVLRRLQTSIAEAGYGDETATQLAYLEKRVQQIDYPRFVACQWPIGSGMVESANKLVVEERLKGAGMHWAEGNVNGMLALRNAICSDRWVEVWTQIEEDQRREQSARRRERQQQRRVSAARELAERLTPNARRCNQPRVADGSGSAPALAPPARSAAEKGRPAADHPWRKAWSIRRQREIASTA